MDFAVAEWLIHEIQRLTPRGGLREQLGAKKLRLLCTSNMLLSKTIGLQLTHTCESGAGDNKLLALNFSVNEYAALMKS